MENGRRGFLKGGAAAAVASGWLLFGKDASAAEKVEGNRILREWDEDIEGGRTHFIEMQLSYDNPMLQFELPKVAVDAPEPWGDRKKVFQAIEQGTARRVTIGRHTADQIQSFHGEKVDLWDLIRKRAAQANKARHVMMTTYPYLTRLKALEHKPAPRLQTRRDLEGVYGIVVVCHCPTQTEVGMAAYDAPFTSKDMFLTIPATLLPKD